MTPEEWADASLTRLWDQIGREEPFSLDVVATAIRAAYAYGYMDALSEPEPLSLKEVLSREAVLRLSVPLP